MGHGEQGMCAGDGGKGEVFGCDGGGGGGDIDKSFLVWIDGKYCCIDTAVATLFFFVKERGMVSFSVFRQ